MTRIYLADLTHTTVTISNDSFPLNVGYIGAFAKKHYPDLEIELFKYPEDLKAAMDRQMPDVLGFSNYPWNLDLNRSFIDYAKERNPSILTVMGGPNVSYQSAEQNAFLSSFAGNLDYYCLYEGEIAFKEVLDCAFRNQFQFDSMKQETIPGSIYFRPNGEFVEYTKIERNKDLEILPSPYLSGMLDKFFDGKLTPLLETHRGCPYTCTYCHEGHSSYSRINKFLSDRTIAEFDYIAARIGDRVTNLMIADPNFGFLPENKELARHIAQQLSKTNYPKTLWATTAKNAKKELIEIASLLKGIKFPVFMSVQSLTENVLVNIRRKDISISQMIEVQREMERNNIPSQSEVILSLPGETLATHLSTLSQLMSMKIDSIATYQLMMVNGSEMKMDLETRQKHGFKTSYRILPRSFTALPGMRPAIETEEIVHHTNEMPHNDYIQARKLHLVNAVFYNGKGFRGFFRLAEENGIPLEMFLDSLLHRFTTDHAFQNLLSEFTDKTNQELFPTESDLRHHYADPAQFQKLLDGQRGENLLQTYACRCLMEKGADLCRVIANAMLDVAPPSADFTVMVEDLRRYYHYSFQNFLAPERNKLVSMVSLRYNVPQWLSDADMPFSETLLERKEIFLFYTSQQQYEQLESYLERFGRTPQAFGKIMTRMWIYEMFRMPKFSQELAADCVNWR